MAPLNNVLSIFVPMMSLALAKELPVNMALKKEIYETGAVHEQIMATKHVGSL